MFVNQSTLAALNVEVSESFQSAFEDVETFADKIALRVTSSSALNLYAFVHDQIRVREWLDAREPQALKSYVYSLPNRRFESTLEVRREDILDDALGLFYAASIPGFAEAVRKHPDEMLIDAVFKANPLAYDGLPYWSSNHPTYVGSGTYDNDVDAPAPDDATFGESLALIRAGMMTVPSQSGRLLKVSPRALLIPPEQEFRVRKVVDSSLIASTDGAAIDNPIRGMFDQIIVIPELSGVSADGYKTIYMADLSKPVKPFLHQVRSNPKLVSFDTGAELDAIRRDVFSWFIDGDDGGPYRMNVGVTLPFLCTRITLTDLPA